MSDGTPTPDKNETVEETPKKKNELHPLVTVALLAALLLATIGWVWWQLFSQPTDNDAVAEAPAPPAETPVAETIVPGPVTVAVNAETRLAPVEIKRVDHLCAIVTFNRDVIEGVDLAWPTRSGKERWEVCGTDLKKEAPDTHGAMSLTVGGKRIKLSEVIATTGGEYTALQSTPGALARCWGEGQVNGDGLPACTPKPADVVAQNAAAK